MKMPYSIKKATAGSLILTGLLFALAGRAGTEAALPSAADPVPFAVNYQDEPLVPARQVIIFDREVPAWKKLWDEARQEVRLGRYEQAVESYRSLLAARDNLEEAQWELTRLLLHLRQWDEAAARLELLIEADPHRLSYLNGLGRLMYEKGRFDRAADLFGQAYERGSMTALTGLVNALLKGGRKTEALPLLDELFHRRADDFGVRRALALLSYELGDFEKARSHLVILAERQDADPEILLRTAQVHEKLGLANPAVAYWQRILAKDPDNREAHIRLADFFERGGRLKEALPHLLAQYRQDPADSTMLTKIGGIYLTTGRMERALSYYERYLSLNPQDKEAVATVVRIQESLASDLRANGEEDQALSLWKSLAKGAPNRLAIYRTMAELLTPDLGAGGQELLAVLEVIHGLDPADEPTTLRLAIMHLDRGNLADSRIFFEKLARAGCRSADFFSGRGRLYERLQLPELALQDYEDLLQLFPDRDEVRPQVIRLAGGLGRLAVVLDQLGRVRLDSAIGREMDFKLIKAAALAENGYYEAAVSQYRRIIETAGSGAPAAKGKETAGRDRAWLGLAAAYRAAGLEYEAEQTLRQALSADHGNADFALALFELALTAGRYEAAENWLQMIERHATAGSPWKIHILEARLLAAKGNLRAAVKKTRQLFNDLPNDLPPNSRFDNGPAAPDNRPRLQVGLALCRFLLADEKWTAAERICRTLLVENRDYPELLVLEGEIFQRAGQPDKAEEVWGRARQAAAMDLSGLLRLAELYRAYGEPALMYDTARLACQKTADSIKAEFLMAEALADQGKWPEALVLFTGIEKRYPENTRAAANLAGLLFKLGRFEEALVHCDAVLAGRQERPDILMLKARILWACHRWDEALALYKTYLEPPVEKMLAGQIKDNKLILELPPPHRTIWDVITFSEGDSSGLLEVVMSPVYAAGNNSPQKQAVNDLAIPLYARYRWQERFALEMAARRAVQRREYNKAAARYEDLLSTYPSEELAFDLAGIYSQIGRLGEEADLYEELRTSNPAFPGLAEAAQRNRLKTRPQLALGAGRQERESWDDYQAIQKKWQELNLWFSPRIQHEVDLTAARIRYRSTNSDAGVWSKRAFLSFKSNLSEDVAVTMGGGVENLEDGHPDTGIFRCSLLGRIGDKVKGRVALIREVSADTIASLTRNITQQDIEAGITFDFFPRLLLGGEYGFSDYSDDNQQYNYTLWSSYIILPEPTFLKFSYSYDFEDAQEGARPGVPTEDGFAVDDHPYWNPVNYWLNRFSLYFKHQLADDLFKRGIPKYYVVEYSLGYDSRGNDLQALQASFFMELTRNFIMKAATEFTDSETYRSKEFYLSATYRW